LNIIRKNNFVEKRGMTTSQVRKGRLRPLMFFYSTGKKRHYRRGNNLKFLHFTAQATLSDREVDRPVPVLFYLVFQTDPLPASQQKHLTQRRRARKENSAPHLATLIAFSIYITYFINIFLSTKALIDPTFKTLEEKMISILHSSRILHRMVILAVLVAGLSFVVMVKNATPVHAAPCCFECDEAAEYCLNVCDWGAPGGDPNCVYKHVSDCYQEYGVYFCWAHCVTC
jgi:hypothetical protein